MKKNLWIALVVLLILAMTACNSAKAPGTEPESPEQSSNTPASDTTASEAAAPSPEQEPDETDSGNEPDTASEGGNILIAYFTWAENTVVEDPDAVDVDAVTSASVLPPGNTAKLAGWIQEATDGDVFSIITEQPYPSDYDECLDQASEEHDADARPALTGSVESMDGYDVVFLGYPNWWYSCPMAILTFIEENDLSGKTIVPFCAHGTGGLSGSVRDITAELPGDCTVLEAFGVYRPDVDSAQPEINEWLAGLGVEY